MMSRNLGTLSHPLGDIAENFLRRAHSAFLPAGNKRHVLAGEQVRPVTLQQNWELCRPRLAAPLRRSLWNRGQIAEGVALVEGTLKSHRSGSYTLQAAIAAVHAEAESAAATDWRQIVALYNRLARIQPSPVVELNRAVAIAMRDGPEIGLAHIDAVLAHGELANYHLAHSARADMCRRLGRTAEARSSYKKALALTQQEPERKFLQERLQAVELNKIELAVDFRFPQRLFDELPLLHHTRNEEEYEIHLFGIHRARQVGKHVRERAQHHAGRVF